MQIILCFCNIKYYFSHLLELLFFNYDGTSYLDAFCRRGVPPRGRNPPRFLRQKSWWWQGREHPDRHPFDVPNHDVCNFLRPHCHRHPRRTTPRRTQRYVYTVLFPRSLFVSTKAPLVYVARIAADFHREFCKTFCRVVTLARGSFFSTFVLLRASNVFLFFANNFASVIILYDIELYKIITYFYINTYINMLNHISIVFTQ